MIRAILRNIGIRPRRIPQAICGWRRYLRERAAFKKLPGADSMPWGREMPILAEWNDASGGLGGYFFQDLLVARWIHADHPRRHIDVGSRIDGFIGHLAVFRNVDVIDIRPQPARIPNVMFHQLDLMKPLPNEWLECTDSLSCLHSIEHFGLGRYGDTLDPTGHLKGLEQLKNMVAPGGKFYLSAPVGRERIEFNAHRVFSPSTLTGWFRDGWRIERFALIDDDHRLHEDVDLSHGGMDTLRGVGILVASRTDRHS